MLEKKLEDPSDENRVRLLGGDDPEPEVLAKKIEELELRLAEKEEKLLEKDLIFEEVTRLADRTKKKSETGKEDTLELAKKVCCYQLSSTDLYTFAYPFRSFQFAHSILHSYAKNVPSVRVKLRKSLRQACDKLTLSL